MLHCVFVIQQDAGVPCTQNSPVLLLPYPYPLLSLNINVQEPSETANFQHNTNSNNNWEMQQKLHCYMTFSSDIIILNFIEYNMLSG